MSYFAIDALSVVFRQFQLRGVSLSLQEGQTLVLLGPSGSGKSVLLESIAGFHPLNGGSIQLDGREISALPPEERGLGFMFQDYALFPHLTVEQNIAFGLRRSREAGRRAKELLERLGLSQLAGRRPGRLSGGEKQRVALARAMAIQPRLFLFDEPLSALDALMRDSLREELRLQLRALGATSLYVTHDRQEALMLADVIAIIQSGAIRQAGSPAELFDHPADAWVAEFLGLQVLAPRDGGHGSPVRNSSGRIKMRVGDGVLEVSVNGGPIPEAARVVFRPEDVRLERLNGACLNGQPLPAEGIPAVVESVVPLGALYRIDLNGGVRFHALLLRPELQRLALKPGHRVLATIHPDDLALVPEVPAPVIPPLG